MKKLQIFTLAAAALVFGLASCTNGVNEPVSPDLDGKSAYVSFQIEKQARAGRSTEDPGVATESDIKSLYIVTFNSSGSVVKIPDGGYYIVINGSPNVASTITARKVGGETTQVLAVANPGAKMLAALNALTQGSTYTVFNEAIKSITAKEINTTGGFTMISSPVDTGKNNGDQITSALIPVNPKVVGTGAGEYATDGAAIEAAEKAENLTKVGVERLATKLVLTDAVPTNVLPAGATFAFDSWTVDALNTTFYPYATRTLSNTTHTGTYYTFNFYTEDPNFADTQPYHNDGSIVYGTVDPTKASLWAPILPYGADGYGWMDAASNKTAYMVENTMAAAAQRYGNATRVVIKGTYAPAGFTRGDDWFRFGGKDYKTLALLQAAYTASLPGGSAPDTNLVAACDAFLAQVKVANPLITTTDFATLAQGELDAILANGGEVAKVPVSGVGIRWFQKSVNYWYYEIRHDAEKTGTMEFTKYGVVRNNWYNLSLDNVTGAGTPWYPDLINPGDGDPKPEDPIDSKYGYIGISITPAPWIIWENSMSI